MKSYATDIPGSAKCAMITYPPAGVAGTIPVNVAYPLESVTAVPSSLLPRLMVTSSLSGKLKIVATTSSSMSPTATSRLRVSSPTTVGSETGRLPSKQVSSASAFPPHVGASSSAYVKATSAEVPIEAAGRSVSSVTVTVNDPSELISTSS